MHLHDGVRCADDAANGDRECNDKGDNGQDEALAHDGCLARMRLNLGRGHGPRGRRGQACAIVLLLLRYNISPRAIGVKLSECLTRCQRKIRKVNNLFFLRWSDGRHVHARRVHERLLVVTTEQQEVRGEEGTGYEFKELCDPLPCLPLPARARTSCCSVTTSS